MSPLPVEPWARVAAIYRREPTPEDLGSTAAGPPRGDFERVRVPPAGAIPVGPTGLAGSVSLANSARLAKKGFLPEEGCDRAVLVQTSANLKALAAAGLKLREPLTDQLVPGCFGENLFLDSPGLLPDQVCVGDELACWRAGEQQPLRMQVVSPRCPCAKVDQKLGKTYNINGVRAHCAHTALAGFFLRVLFPGDLQEGDVFVLDARPHPSWTVARVARLLYGHPTANMNYLQRSKTATTDQVTQAVKQDEWMGTEEELQELAALPELAVCEYKEHLHNLLGLPGIGRYRPRGTLRAWRGRLETAGAAHCLSAGLLAAACVAVLVSRRAK